jgi:hypothetical protein
VTTKAEKEHLSRVAALGCIVCKRAGYGYSEAQIHHLKDGHGSTRASHFETIPLCYKHHLGGGPGVAFHSGKQTWEGKYGTQRDLLAIIMKELSSF